MMYEVITLSATTSSFIIDSPAKDTHALDEPKVAPKTMAGQEEESK